MGLIKIFKKCFKEKTKLTKLFYKYDQAKEDKKKNKLEAKATYYTEQILKVTNDYILQMGNKLNHAKVDPKAHWSVSNKFLHNKKILAKKIISDFASICEPINHRSALQNES